MRTIVTGSIPGGFLEVIVSSGSRESLTAFLHIPGFLTISCTQGLAGLLADIRRRILHKGHFQVALEDRPWEYRPDIQVLLSGG
mgnify:CR=1 FL=1